MAVFNPDSSARETMEIFSKTRSSAVTFDNEPKKTAHWLMFAFSAGTKVEHFAKIGWKNHKHSVNNP